MKKILFYSHTGEVSGAENILLLLVKKLNRARFAPVAVCPKAGGLSEKFRELGVPARTVRGLEARFTWRVDLFFKYLFSFFQVIGELRGEIRRENPDLVHANSIRAGLVAAAASRGTKTPVFWHIQDELKPHPFSTLIRLFVLFSKRTRLIAASEATARSFRGKLLEIFDGYTPLRVVHNAVEPEKFAAADARRSEIRREFDLAENSLALGIIGQITPRKGQLELVEIFAKIAPKIPQARLLIVGKPMFNRDFEYLRSIEKKIEKLNLSEKVLLLGQRGDVPAIMRALDILVVNSKSEALVVVAIEAMASRTPVIATDAGGTGEIIANGKNGFLVEFGNSVELENAIVKLAGDERMRLEFAERGELVVREKLSAGKFIGAIEEFFGEFTPAPDNSDERISSAAEVKRYV